MIRLWTHCPNCDALLPEPVAVGDDWECAECGAYGTRRSGKYDSAPLVPLFHEQEEKNVVRDDGLSFWEASMRYTVKRFEKGQVLGRSRIMLLVADCECFVVLDQGGNIAGAHEGGLFRVHVYPFRETAVAIAEILNHNTKETQDE